MSSFPSAGRWICQPQSLCRQLPYIFIKLVSYAKQLLVTSILYFYFECLVLRYFDWSMSTRSYKQYNILLFSGENYVMKSFIICSLLQIIIE
jgi:hypothetical protein